MAIVRIGSGPSRFDCLDLSERTWTGVPVEATTWGRLKAAGLP